MKMDARPPGLLCAGRERDREKGPEFSVCSWEFTTVITAYIFKWE